MGKSSSRELRRVVYYTLYRMDPEKTYQKKMLLRKNDNNPKMRENAVYIPPLAPDQPPLKGGRYVTPILGATRMRATARLQMRGAGIGTRLPIAIALLYS